MAYTTIDDPTAYFQTAIWTGNGSSSHAITFDGNSDLQPDWTWIKSRSNATDHILTDIVRSVGVGIKSNTTAGNANDSNQLKSFNSNGFTLGSENDVNGSSRTYASWNWKAGTSFTNDASSTGIGTIDSTGSVNTDAGFSIITFTGTGSSGPVVAHGLGSVPKMMIFKNIGAASAWTTYHHSVITASGSNKSYLTLNTSDGKRTNGTDTTFLAVNTATFTLGTDEGLNKSSNNYIAYCFADVQGYSKVSGSYKGNGNADGTFVYTGFKPAFAIIKRSSASGSWYMYDTKRDTHNVMNKELGANISNAENDLDGGDDIDFLSNGFKLRDASSNNDGNSTYIYMAFAENPFVTSTGVPATAR